MDNRATGHQTRKRNATLLLSGQRYCPDCKRDRPLVEFYANKGYCVECERVRGARHKTRRKLRHKERAYGITPEDYLALQETQGNRCAICGEVAALVVDHDHATGIVRGLLCDLCNRAIGLLRDDPARLASAILYLEKRR